jgi:hypothetical protein
MQQGPWVPGPSPGWPSKVRGPALGGRSGCLFVGIGLLAPVLGALSVWVGFRVAVAAALDCGIDFDAGNRFAMSFLMVCLLAAVPCVNFLLSMLATWWRPWAGLLVVVLVPATVALWIVATHALGAAPIDMSPESAYYGGELCPSGLPPWWPWWLPG